MNAEDEAKKASLIKFEAEIASLFNSGKILAPVHLSDNNEDQIIEIFKKIKKDDWVFSMRCRNTPRGTTFRSRLLLKTTGTL